METHIGSRKDHKVLAYTLSTCGWCKKMKRLLDELDVHYSFIDLDKVPDEEKEQVMAEFKKHNPRCSAPTLIVDDGKEVIIGFQEEKVKEVLGLDGPG